MRSDGYSLAGLQRPEAPPGSPRDLSQVLELEAAVLGGGFTGVYCARTAAAKLARDSTAQVGLLSEENFMVFQPLLPEVAGSAISPRHVVNPLRLLCRGVQVFKGRVEEICWPERSLVLNAGPFSGRVRIRYRHLVLALGAILDLSRIPGMPEHALPMRNVGDAMRLRATIIGRVEEANLEPQAETKRRLLTFVVVGGGYSGVETAGHILDLFRSIHRYYSNVALADFQVYLIHSQNHLLPTLSRRLGDYAGRKLQERGLKLVLNQRVKAVTADRVHLQDGSSIETNTVICTVGNAPHPLITQLCQAGGFESVKGQIVTAPTGQVKGQTHLWAGGDCAAVPFVQGGFCPNTAQFALRQGILIGKNLVRFARHQPLRAFTFKGHGEMASIGHHVAVADILGFTFSGFAAWWLWRSIYLTKLPRLDRKIRVMLEWTLDLFFPRDISHLSPRFSELLQEIYLEPGDVLFQRGEPAFSLYLVKSGCLEIRDATGVVGHISPGEHFGEQALLQSGLWQHDGKALEPSWLVSIPVGVFHQLVHGAGSLAQFFLKSAAKYQSQEMLQSLSRKTAPEVAALPVARLMQSKLYTLRSDMTLREVLEVARRHPRSSYPVLDGADRLLGLVNRDALYEFIKGPDTTPETPLRQMPFAQALTVPTSASVAETLADLIRTGSNKALVLDAGEHLAGIITVVDILAAQNGAAFTKTESRRQHAQAA